MFRNITLVLVIAFLVACSSSSNDPVTLEGVWTSIENPDSTSRMSAIISDDEIEISILDDDGTRMLYWLGTVPEAVTSDDTFISNADVEALSVAIMGLLKETKEFTYKNGELSFEQGLMGMSWTVTMRKVK